MNNEYLDNKIEVTMLSDDDLDNANFTGPEELLEITRTAIPFGKYSGRLLMDLPEDYVAWFARKGFPKGRIGELLRILYEIHTNGLTFLFDPFRAKK